MEDISDVDDYSLLDPRPAEPKYLLQSMFASICHQFTCDTGRNTLIPSPSLHEARQLLLLNVVTMKLRRNVIFPNIKEYSTYDIRLTDLLIGQPVLGLQPVELKYCSHNSDNTCSLDWNIGANMIQLINLGFGIVYDVAISCKLGDLLERKIEYSSFMSAIKERKLDMNHHFIREIKDTKQVLCVIIGVIVTSDKAEIKCANKTDGNINLSRKLSSNIEGGTDIGSKANSDRAMHIEPGTTLAYYLWELEEDSGEITPIMTKYQSGGFSKADNQKIEEGSMEKYEYFKAQKKKKSNVKSSKERCHKHNKGNPCPHRNAQKKNKSHVRSSKKRYHKSNEGNPPPHSNENAQRDRNVQYSMKPFSLYGKCIEMMQSNLLSIAESLREPCGGFSSIYDEEVEETNSICSVELLEFSSECSLIDGARLQY